MAKSKPIDINHIFNAVDKAMRDVAEKEVRVLRRGTQTWRTKVSFRIVKVNGYYSIQTDNQVWKWVNYGTRPHYISSRGNYPLRYQTDFKPKTEQGRITSTNGGKFGSNWVSPYTVYHTGAEARDFLANLEPKREQRISDSLDKYLNKVK